MGAVKIDDRYRITIPQEVRAGLKPGDVLFVVREERAEGPVLHAAKAINPFDALIELAREEERRGVEIPLEEFARERGLDLAALKRQEEALAGLAEAASAEDRRGETVDLRDLAKEFGVELPDGR